MTPDPIPNEKPPEARSTAGMTTKVVKGSLWTLSGQVAPLAASIVATPFSIRLLGSESYGALILVTMLPTYLGFADVGMGLASTKFASAEYSKGNLEREGILVRTAAFIALCSTVPLVSIFIVAAMYVVVELNTPEGLRYEAAIALRLTLVAFLLNTLSSIFNSPQLSRLKMSQNALIGGGFRVFGILLTPIVIYLGFGLVGAGTVVLFVSLGTLISHVIVGVRHNNRLLGLSIDLKSARPMLRFGIALAVGSIAGVVLSNLEKTILPKLTSVGDLAYFSVAATLASMTSLLPQAMVQTMIPALSGLNDKASIKSLFSRSIRMNIVLILPALVVLLIVAYPLFELWAGSGFGEKSSPIFYVLLIGFFFNVVALSPLSIVIAGGNTTFLAKLYWAEVLPYIFLVYVLTSYFGVIGAAAAWSIRLFFDCICIAVMGLRSLEYSLAQIIVSVRKVGMLLAISILPILVFFYGNRQPTILLVVSLFVSLFCFLFVTWRFILSNDERQWFSQLIRRPIQ